MRTILLTGGAGFIGSHVAEACLRRGWRVVIVDNFDPYYAPAIKERNVREAVALGAELVRADICDFDAMGELFATRGFDTLVHLAALAGVRPSIVEPMRYMRVNAEGTTGLLELCRLHGVKRVCFASSSSVYGDREQVPFRESDPVDDPVSPYAASKKAGELIAWTYHHLWGMDIDCLRFFTVYGPRQRPEMAIHKFVRALLDDEEITLFGDGSSSRDYTYIDDIVQGVLSSIDHLSGYRIINLGESTTISLRELVSSIERATGKPARIRWAPMQAGDVLRTFADVSRARELLGYAPSTDIDTGLRRFVDWLMAERAAAPLP